MVLTPEEESLLREAPLPDLARSYQTCREEIRRHRQQLALLKPTLHQVREILRDRLATDYRGKLVVIGSVAYRATVDGRGIEVFDAIIAPAGLLPEGSDRP